MDREKEGGIIEYQSYAMSLFWYIDWFFFSISLWCRTVLRSHHPFWFALITFGLLPVSFSMAMGSSSSDVIISVCRTWCSRPSVESQRDRVETVTRPTPQIGFNNNNGPNSFSVSTILPFPQDQLQGLHTLNLENLAVYYLFLLAYFHAWIMQNPWCVMVVTSLLFHDWSCLL